MLSHFIMSYVVARSGPLHGMHPHVLLTYNPSQHSATGGANEAVIRMLISIGK